MSTVKQAHPARVALTRAIESRVERMDMAGLLELVAALKVSVPVTAKAPRGREQKPMIGSSDREEAVLQGAGIGPVVSASDGSRLLDAITVDDDSADWVESDLVGASELVDRLKISRAHSIIGVKRKRSLACAKGCETSSTRFDSLNGAGPLRVLTSSHHFSRRLRRSGNGWSRLTA
jgi:hypothetical protein